jgi:hypothetical protein
MPKVRVNVKASLSRRLREIRQEIFGEHGGPELARRLGLPARSWYNYETGVTVPAEVLLDFIEQTGAHPTWLLTGVGPRFRDRHEHKSLKGLTPIELIRLALKELERMSSDGDVVVPENFPKTDDRLQSALTAQVEGRLRMCESYQGEVVDVHEDSVVVVYGVNGDIIEQTYERSQFLEGHLPEVGAVLAASVMLYEIDPRVDEPVPVEDERDDDVPSYERKPLDEPTIF